MTLLTATPVLPVLNIPRSVAYYTERLGFTATGVYDDYATLARDDIEIHLWEANNPNMPGAEPHIAGTASCRIRVSGVDALYEEMRSAGVIHPNGAITDQPWGREFTVVDAENPHVNPANVIVLWEPR